MFEKNSMTYLCNQCRKNNANTYRVDLSFPDLRFCNECWFNYETQFDVQHDVSDMRYVSYHEKVCTSKLNRRKNKKKQLNNVSCYSQKAIRKFEERK